MRLSTSRGAVLDALVAAGRALTIAEVATALAVHPNTAREHLEGLVSQGAARRLRSSTGGRGRPAWCYEPDETARDPRIREYASLAAALAAHIVRTSPDPRADGLRAGETWGAELARDAEPSPAAELADPAGEARRRVVALFAELGFDPQADPAATTVALRACPLLDTARRYPDVVCAVHLGIARGALDVLGGEPDHAELQAFAEPGACRLTLLAPGIEAGDD